MEIYRRPGLRLNKEMLCSFVSALILQASVLLTVCIIPTFLHFLSFLLVILLFKMAPKCSAEVLSGIPKHKKAKMCLKEKKKKWHISFLQGMSYSTVDHEFNVNELTICILKGVFKQTDT